MKLKRRSFLKLSIASIFAGTFGCKGDHKTPFALPGPVPTKEPKFGDAPVSTICPFCGVGCGQIVTTTDSVDGTYHAWGVVTDQTSGDELLVPAVRLRR